MTKVIREDGSWIASDGNWYPAELHPDAQVSVAAGGPGVSAEEVVSGSDSRPEPPAAGWWMASDYKWYPPVIYTGFPGVYEVTNEPAPDSMALVKEQLSASRH